MAAWHPMDPRRRLLAGQGTPPARLRTTKMGPAAPISLSPNFTALISLAHPRRFAVLPSSFVSINSRSFAEFRTRSIRLSPPTALSTVFAIAFDCPNGLPYHFQ